MSPRQTIAPAALLVAVLSLAGGLAACSSNGLGITEERTEGFVIPDDALQQIRTGVSRDFVEVVLGSPQTTSTAGGEEAYYYVETKVSRTAFGLSNPTERTVLAVYFDGNHKVSDKAVYTLQDGKVFTVVGRRTPGYGADETFIEAILKSVGGIRPFG
jgi:outer membrane protein assembly factor BamE (lipoprotein component of BamABCDE complex)